DIFRCAATMTAGKIRPSQLLRKLASSPRQNNLAVPLREVGRIERTLFRHCCKVSDEAAFCLIQRPYISKTLLTRRISPRGSP
ncbi:MAG: Tn3 family transposase, partial [Escherichia coli]|nr:Tn3 family transposase [Escherichia coli]